jgi:hypothetical protein
VQNLPEAELLPKVCTAAQRRIRALESGTLAATILSGLEGTP